MKSIATLGGVAMFLAGAAVSLLASYPISENNLYVCFVAVFVGLAACIVGGCAIALYATKTERIRTDRLVELTVDHLLKRRGLELVDRD